SDATRRLLRITFKRAVPHKQAWFHSHGKGNYPGIQVESHGKKNKRILQLNLYRHGMTINKNFHWFICILFLLSCARQSSPTGGPKDTIPPTLLKSVPPNEALNFRGNNIELTFSEMVIINSPKEQLIITPTIGKDYKITARKNVVKL